MQISKDTTGLNTHRQPLLMTKYSGPSNFFNSTYCKLTIQLLNGSTFLHRYFTKAKHWLLVFSFLEALVILTYSSFVLSIFYIHEWNVLMRWGPCVKMCVLTKCLDCCAVIVVLSPAHWGKFLTTKVYGNMAKYWIWIELGIQILIWCVPQRHRVLHAK